MWTIAISIEQFLSIAIEKNNPYSSCVASLVRKDRAWVYFEFITLARCIEFTN